ncbi:MAG: hypothetical protein GYB67_15665 [Chloroflexi bacterium]|nr:hypothetical protein [Chloroflexota bacterium]
MIYKVSYVVLGGGHPGSIKTQTDQPRVGDRVRLGPNEFEIVEVQRMMPERDDLQFLHATVKPLTQPETS